MLMLSLFGNCKKKHVKLYSHNHVLCNLKKKLIKTCSKTENDMFCVPNVNSVSGLSILRFSVTFILALTQPYYCI